MTLQKILGKPSAGASKVHVLFVTTDSRNGDCLRPQFCSAGVFPSRILEAQAFHEWSECLLYGGVNEAGNWEDGCWVLTLTKSLVRSRISSFSHQVFVTWAKPSAMLCQTKSIVSHIQRRAI